MLPHMTFLQLDRAHRSGSNFGIDFLSSLENATVGISLWIASRAWQFTLGNSWSIPDAEFIEWSMFN